MKLPCELNRGFGGFRSTRGEIDAAAVAEIRRSHRQQAGGELFRGSRVKLRSVCESNLRRLLRHGPADFSHSVTDTDDGSLPGSIKETSPIGCDNPATFSMRCNGKRFFKMAGEKSTAHR